MGWFPCSGRSEKPRKKKPDNDDPVRPSSTSASTSACTTSSSSDKMKVLPPMRMQKEVSNTPNAKREVNQTPTRQREVNHTPRGKREPYGKREVNPLAKKEVKLLLDIKEEVSPALDVKKDVNPLLEIKKEMSQNQNAEKDDPEGISEAPTARIFTFEELDTATKNFRDDCFLGEGGFGKVYKGRLLDTKEVVAIKQLDRNGLQGNKEFLVEVLMLSLLHHTNLVNLIGYCADGDQRLLVYEYMPLGSLEYHLHDLSPRRPPLDWNARMRIAAGAAKGLEYLHDEAKPPVIYRDLKSSNILLGEGYYPKLSDFGLAKLGPIGDKSHVSTRVMGTYGYCAPEYAMTGQLTLKSDIYSFGVVLLEIITGRKAIDETKSGSEQNLVAWARPMFRDRKKFSQMADPKLKGLYPMRGLYQALAVAAMCVQEQATLRPAIADVVTALTYLANQSYMPESQSAQSSQSAQGSHSAPATPSRPKKVYTKRFEGV